MARQADRLYELVPAIHRIRDVEQGYPLRSLLQIITEQVEIVEANIAQLYENWFIETCEDWVVPYIGDLVGYRIVHEAGEPGDAITSAARNKILIPRRDVADTIRNRRRKGALALLEELARDTSGWPARAVEFYRLLGWTQNLNYPHPDRGGTIDLRGSDVFDRLNGAFDEIAHTIDVRRINSHRAQGRYNIPSAGLFVWRLKSYSVTKAPAHCEDWKRHHYTFSILGNDAPLFTQTVAEPAPAHIADEMNVPAPIRRRALEERLEDYYGEGKSLVIYRDNLTKRVPSEDIIVADLSNWSYRPTGQQVAVDPQLGRIAFAARRAPLEGVWVTYYYGFSADIGGGEYDRRVAPGKAVIKVGTNEAIKRISDAIAEWRKFRQKPDVREQWADAVIELTDSGCYTEPLAIELYRGERLELRAAANTRPVIRLLDFYGNRPDALQITGKDEAYGGYPPQQQECNDKRAARIILDGLLITGRGLQIRGALESVMIRHCTLVPGWALDTCGNPKEATEPSLELIDTTARVNIEHSILGAIQVTQNEVSSEPLPINISDTILDATGPELEAVGSPECPVAHVVLTIRRCTVIGKIEAHAIQLAENCIFDGMIKVARRQTGCMRFCFAPPGSRTPRRYECQPDLVLVGITDSAARTAELARVRPRFNSTRYGNPAYCQLAATCADEIKRGADDESELGAFQDLFQPQREANLRARLDEFTPAGLNVGVIFAS